MIPSLLHDVVGALEAICELGIENPWTHSIAATRAIKRARVDPFIVGIAWNCRESKSNEITR